MANDLKVGDVVQLNSGGPRMTVIDLNNNSISVMYWNAGANEYGFYNGLNIAAVAKV